MYVNCEKVILTDCDGVLLDWLNEFKTWMDYRGYKVIEKESNAYDISKVYGITRDEGFEMVMEFNASSWMLSLSPFGGAIHYVQKLHREYGYVFHCITSMSKDPKAKELRRMNLDNVFGKGIFTELECLDCGADKDEALEKYRDSSCWFFEDMPKNADTGLDFGLNSILLAQPHNADYTGAARVAADWKEVFEIVVGL